jgi:hypothetical protein
LTFSILICSPFLHLQSKITLCRIMCVSSDDESFLKWCIQHDD